MIEGVEIPGHVVGETVDGETIVIDLLTGAYHTLEGDAVRVWGLLGTPDTSAAEAADLAVLADLAAAGIIVVSDPTLLPADAALGGRGLTSYTDMAQLLLADPIHEVDDRGWPILRQQ